MVEPFRRDVGAHVHVAAPLLDGFIGEPGFFKCSAQIDVRRPELWIELQALAQRLDRAGDIAILPRCHRIVEARQMQQRIGVVECDPGLVEIDDQRPQTAGAQIFRDLDQFAERQLLTPRALENAGERRRLVRGNGVVDRHGRPAAKRPVDQAEATA